MQQQQQPQPAPLADEGVDKYVSGKHIREYLADIGDPLLRRRAAAGRIRVQRAQHGYRRNLYHIDDVSSVFKNRVMHRRAVVAAAAEQQQQQQAPQQPQQQMHQDPEEQLESQLVERAACHYNGAASSFDRVIEQCEQLQHAQLDTVKALVKEVIRELEHRRGQLCELLDLIDRGDVGALSAGQPEVVNVGLVLNWLRNRRD